MTVTTVTLDRLEQIAFNGHHQIAVDATRNVGYLRRGRVMYESPLSELEPAS
jgi:hypothetical protein